MPVITTRLLPKAMSATPIAAVSTVPAPQDNCRTLPLAGETGFNDERFFHLSSRAGYHRHGTLRIRSLMIERGWDFSTNQALNGSNQFKSA